MARYVALARGINVGGRHLVPMVALRAACEGLGFTGVATYIQSGNVIFDAPSSAAAVASTLGATLEAQFGFAIPIVVRTPTDLVAVRDACPFPDADPSHLSVVFLNRAPDVDPGELDPARSPGDRAVARGREVYLWCPGGIGRTKLTPEWIERQVGGRTGTNRNWRTLEKLIALSP